MPEEQVERIQVESTTEYAGKVLRWRDANPFEERQLTPEDWKTLGVEEGALVRWNTANGFSVPRHALDFADDAALHRLLSAESRFAFVDPE